MAHALVTFPRHVANNGQKVKLVGMLPPSISQGEKQKIDEFLAQHPGDRPVRAPRGWTDIVREVDPATIESDKKAFAGQIRTAFGCQVRIEPA